ncbi:MAG: UDP-N-acetylmuramoyl-L-alanine--D-glutamate ligase [Woeseiaceae bacterium]|nr:UDP-N-acetylmuramoyl-L-alanine--D-glutamate ligase [Woeseiaceae bacterium]
MSAVRKRQPLQKDLVVGLGATGLSVARFLQRTGRDARFFDTRDEPPGIEELQALWPDAEIDTGEINGLPSDIDRIVVSPGVKDSHPLLEEARTEGIEIVSDIDLFVAAAEAPFAAITGSNGKSTVTTLLHHMCLASGKSALAGGNLGCPALDLLDEDTPDWYVLELSSFQLQRTKSLPAAVAVLLNISPDHLDWHADEAEYRAAKYRIFDQADAVVFNRDEADIAGHAQAVERRLSFGLGEPESEAYGRRIEDGKTYLARGQSMLFDVADMAMFGIHNQANALAALAAGTLMELPLDSMLQVLCEFPGLPHRMQRVARHASVDYIDDSKATNVAAALAAIDSVENPIVLIAGGEGKGGDFSLLKPALEDRLRAAVLIGTDARAIAKAIDPVGPRFFASDMEDAVDQASRCAEPGDVVLLAPACASFDQFPNYMARGEAFAEAARRIAS